MSHSYYRDRSLDWDQYGYPIYHYDHHYDYNNDYANYHRDEPQKLESAELTENEWIVEMNLQAITERGEHMSSMAEEARTKFKKTDANPLMYLLEDESPLSIALIEQNEREREMTIHRVQEEQ